jgi:hypothetical protein
MRTQRFTATVAGRGGRMVVPVPFDPDKAWGPKSRHHVTGTVNGIKTRAVLERADEGWAFALNPTTPTRAGLATGDTVEAVLEPEGPQRDDLAEDVATALAADPEAGAFFDALAQFYRRGYLRWIDATKRRPDERAARIAEMVRLLKAGTKQRPR